MSKISHLQKALFLMAITASLAINNPKWWVPVSVILYMYYALFILNLSKKVYFKRNILTKAFFETKKMPTYVAAATFFITILFVKKNFPEASVNHLYITGLFGAATSLFAQYRHRFNNL